MIIEPIYYRLKEPFNEELPLYRVTTADSTFEISDLSRLDFPLSIEKLPLPSSYIVAPYISSFACLNATHDAPSIKVKITKLSFLEGKELLLEVLKVKKGKIRVDANQTLTKDELFELANLIPKDRLDYFEEPLASFDDYEGIDLPIALDESLKEGDLENKICKPFVKAVVIKPFWIDYQEVVTLAKKYNKMIVLGSSYEEPTPILRLAELLQLTDVPLGIDTERYKEKAIRCPILDKDPKEIALILENGSTFTFQELNEEIQKAKPTKNSFIAPTLTLTFIVEFFQALRLGLTIEFGKELSPYQLPTKPFTTIPERAKVVFTTSGTTGKKKRIVWRAQDLIGACQNTHTNPLPWKQKTFFSRLDPSRIGGIAAIVRAFYWGHLNLNKDQASDIEFVVPTQLLRIVADQEPQLAKAYIVGGAKLSSNIKQIAIARQIDIYIAYGATEFGSFFLDGIPYKDCTFKLSSDGELLIKTPYHALDLVNIDREGFIHTNDRASVFSDGKIEILERMDDVIISGGHKIYLSFIESTLSTHPNLLYVKAFKVPSIEWGEELAIIYYGKERLDPILLKEWCRQHLDRYDVPKHFVYLDHFPNYKLSLELLQQLLRDQLLDKRE